MAVHAGGGTALLAFGVALAVLSVERSSTGNVTSFGDAIWWAFTNMTTVGYGDRYPIATRGRMIAMALMLSAIALLGVVTATFATWLVERVSAVETRQTVTSKKSSTR